MNFVVKEPKKHEKEPPKKERDVPKKGKESSKKAPKKKSLVMSSSEDEVEILDGSEEEDPVSTVKPPINAPSNKRPSPTTQTPMQGLLLCF